MPAQICGDSEQIPTPPLGKNLVIFKVIHRVIQYPQLNVYVCTSVIKSLSPSFPFPSSFLSYLFSLPLLFWPLSSFYLKAPATIPLAWLMDHSFPRKFLLLGKHNVRGKPFFHTPLVSGGRIFLTPARLQPSPSFFPSVGWGLIDKVLAPPTSPLSLHPARLWSRGPVPSHSRGARATFPWVRTQPRSEV